MSNNTDTISSKYDPKGIENKWQEKWENGGLFNAKINPAKDPFCVVIPPPNVTGILHMGHALNDTIQDVLIRYKRMSGFETLWMPGTDHAGIATQNVVEKKLAKEGKKRSDLGRDHFIEEVWKWREEYGSTIIRQLKKLGASCDWRRLRFTMDNAYSESVKEVFIHLYEKGLIYRGNYIINWCPRCQTALSDEEAAHQESQGTLYHLSYPLKPGLPDKKAKKRSKSLAASDTHIIVATTRPETMLGDTAVAVNPKDKRYKYLIGRTIILPLSGREIPIIADESVDMKFGTGAVKITPAHDPNDYLTAKRHNLRFITIFNPDATLNAEAGKYRGLDRFAARKIILADLKKAGLLAGEKPHQHAVGHCYRCDTVVEPYLSWQWFVRMKPLAGPAIEAVRNGEIKFYPKRWTKVYLNWMENIHDWCISRQIWWGHRLPVYYCKTCLDKGGSNGDVDRQEAKKCSGIIVSKEIPQKCPECSGTDIRQDEDVLDTWFSSWLWPFATFYWPFNGEDKKHKADLEYFYPTSTLVTAPEIIFFWVARMIMAGYEFTGKKPFSDIYIHGTVRDSSGRKMSKSLGNIIDPLTIIDKFGTDALRFSIISLSSAGQDVFLSENKFESGRNFANKIWNASRFVIMNVDKRILAEPAGKIAKSGLALPERWILSRLNETLKKTAKAMDSYKINEASAIVYDFFWHQFCDWYLEMAKLTITEASTQKVMRAVLSETLRILHPFMPHITEEINQLLSNEESSLLSLQISKCDKTYIDPKAERDMETIISIITFVRNIRAELNFKPDAKFPAILVTEDEKTKQTLDSAKAYIEHFARLNGVAVSRNFTAETSTVREIIGPLQIFLPIEGAVDVAKERTRLSSEIKKIETDISMKSARLSNKEFLAKAPAEVVAKEKEKVSELSTRIVKLRKILAEI